MWSTIISWGSNLLGFLKPVSSILKQWKNEIFIFFAYRRGKKNGRKEANHDSNKEILDQVTKIKNARNDADLRDRVQQKYTRTE